MGLQISPLLKHTQRESSKFNVIESSLLKANVFCNVNFDTLIFLITTVVRHVIDMMFQNAVLMLLSKRKTIKQILKIDSNVNIGSTISIKLEMMVCQLAVKDKLNSSSNIYLSSIYKTLFVIYIFSCIHAY